MATERRLREGAPISEATGPGPQAAPLVRVLERDPELGLRVPATDITEARAALVAPVRRLERGVWEVPSYAGGGGELGYLLLEGLLARDLILAGRTCTELIGDGDLVQPDVSVASDESLVRYHVLWHVLAPVKVAVLDRAFSQALGRWPQVMRALLERAIRRNLRTSIHAALLQLSPVETRLLVLFWYLAERWGRITPQGVSLRLKLSHELLGQLVGCQRASVTTALRRITNSGLVVRRSDRTWLLLGAPPHEYAQLQWSGGSALDWEAEPLPERHAAVDDVDHAVGPVRLQQARRHRASLP
jgi:CRP/FNR family transcriptional regulator, cyclic AMP receptor protein